MSRPKTSMLRIALINTAALALAACNQSPAKLSGALPSAQTATNASHFEALMADEEFSIGAKTPHCIALFGEIKAHRLAFVQSDAWKGVLNTEEWTRFHGLHTGYRSGGCPSLSKKHMDITQPCLEGRDALFNAWNDIEKSTPWEKIRQSTQLQALVARWDDAKATGCVVLDERV